MFRVLYTLVSVLLCLCMDGSSIGPALTYHWFVYFMYVVTTTTLTLVNIPLRLLNDDLTKEVIFVFVVSVGNTFNNWMMIISCHHLAILISLSFFVWYIYWLILICLFEKDKQMTNFIMPLVWRINWPKCERCHGFDRLNTQQERQCLHFSSFHLRNTWRWLTNGHKKYVWRIETQHWRYW